MRLFWKLFCSMVILTTVACSLGGYILIYVQFHVALDREITSVYEENDLFRYTLAREIGRYTSVTGDELNGIVSGVTINTGRGTLVFRISGSDGGTVASTGTMPVTADGLIFALPDGQRGWRITEGVEGRIYVHTASPLTVGDSRLFLENCRDVTEIYNTRREQYQGFFYLMLTLTVAVGMLSFAITALILRPLKRLSAAAKHMAAGELHQRVPVDRDDELGRLSEDFNSMAACIEAQVEELKEAKRRQEDFIGSFAHEIKTPLTSIIGYADLLRSRPSTPGQVRDSAGYIFSEGRRLEALSRKLLDLIVLNRQDFVLQPVPMDAFLQRVGGALRPALLKAGIRLTVRAAAVRVPVEIDLMETVLLNLLDNARKAIDGEGIIVLEGTAENGGYCVRVTDTGKGIPAGELERVTEPFYMVDKSRARSQGGAGLGLALCGRIVALHGGSMEFQSVEGRGTRVSVHLKGGGSR